MNYNEKERLLKIRKKSKKHNPSFRRVESWRKVKVKDSWRKPRGIDNKSRRHKKSGIKSPNPGYRSPKDVRGTHPSGLEDVLIMHKNDLVSLKPTKHGVRISTKLGGRKKIELIEHALDLGFKVFNLGITMQEDLLDTEDIVDDEELEELEDYEEIDEDEDDDVSEEED